MVLPPTPTILYTLDRATLEKIDRGELNALTAMGKARPTDVTPMDIEPMRVALPGDVLEGRELAGLTQA